MDAVCWGANIAPASSYKQIHWILRMTDLAYANHLICKKSGNNCMIGAAMPAGLPSIWAKYCTGGVIMKYIVCWESQTCCLCTSRHLNVATCSAGDVFYHQEFTTQLWGCNYFCTWHVLCTEECKKNEGYVIFCSFWEILRNYGSLNTIVYSFTFSSCLTLPFVWTNFNESWGLEKVLFWTSLEAIFITWKKKNAQNVLTIKIPKR